MLELFRPLNPAWLALGATAAALLLGPAGADEKEPGSAPAETTLIEQAEVRRAQIDVSVIDPRGRRWGSVPGIPNDAFRIWLDGRLLAGAERERVEFDEICAGGGAGPDGARSGHGGDPGEADSSAGGPGVDPTGAGSAETALAPPVPTVIVLADLNYLDARMRHAAARAIDDLSRRVERERIRVKVLVYRRTLVPLTDGFSSDAAELRQAAARLRKTISAGPPRTSLAETLEEIRRRPDPNPRPEDPLAETDPEGPRELNLGLPAMQIVLPGSEQLLELTAGGPRDSVVPSARIAIADIDPRPSVAAIEAVLRSHRGIRGRKALVLFTSGWFDLPEEMWLESVSDSLRAAQGGFSIWPVDSRGLLGSRSTVGNSRLLGYLSAATGGELIQSAGRLSVAFDRAVEQLSCYYLFSVPVEPPRAGPKRHTVSVALDTRRYRKFWHYRVRSASGFTVLDDASRRAQRRLAALMEPRSHRFPEVRVTAGYPNAAPEKGLTAPIEVSVVLADLVFAQLATSPRYQARFSWEGTVTDADSRPLCRLGDGRERHVESGQLPARYPPSLLILGGACRLPGPGRYQIVALVEDLVSGEVGAARALYEIPGPGEGLAPVSALRLGRNSGRDFLFDPGGGESVLVPRDARRRGFVPLREGESVDAADRVLLRFVSCDADRPPAVVLYGYESAEDDPRGAELPRARMQLLLARRGTMEGGGGRCTEFEGYVPENSLEPGRYGLALFDRETRPDSREQLDEWLLRRRSLGRREFVVAPRKTPALPPSEGKRASLAAGTLPSAPPGR